jgi:general secretion pathway protein G
MTLLEIMVVVVIIGLIGTLVGVQVFGQLQDAQRQLSFTQIKQLGEALDLYKLSRRKYPSTGEGLQALTQAKGNEQPFMNKIPKDPWDNDYVYIYPGQHNTRGYDIMSYGPDGVQGGGDDITSWEDLNKD